MVGEGFLVEVVSKKLRLRKSWLEKRGESWRGCGACAKSQRRELAYGSETSSSKWLQVGLHGEEQRQERKGQVRRRREADHEVLSKPS